MIFQLKNPYNMLKHLPFNQKDQWKFRNKRRKNSHARF